MSTPEASLSAHHFHPLDTVPGQLGSEADLLHMLPLSTPILVGRHVALEDRGLVLVAFGLLIFLARARRPVGLSGFSASIRSK